MANTTARTILVGDATVTIINAGDMVINLAEVLAVPESAWRPLYGSSLEGLRPFPSQSIHIALPGASILVWLGSCSRRAFVQKLSPTSLSRTRISIIIRVSRWNAMEATSHAFPMHESC